MAKKWEYFYPYVQPYVPGCPEMVMDAHLQEAASVFCARSEVWRVNIGPEFTSNNVADYELDLTRNAVLENILFLRLDGREMEHVSDRHFAPAVYAAGDPVKGMPVRFSVIEDSTVRMYPTPTKKHTFVGEAVLKPKLSATGVEDFIFESHGRSIALGAVARITEIPNKEWSNLEVSMKHSMEFERRMCAAKGRETRRVNLKVAPVGFTDVSKRR
jgi:hypothetical protein